MLAHICLAFSTSNFLAFKNLQKRDSLVLTLHKSSAKLNQLFLILSIKKYVKIETLITALTSNVYTIIEPHKSLLRKTKSEHETTTVNAHTTAYI
jgi:hypothetical protein